MFWNRTGVVLSSTGLAVSMTKSLLNRIPVELMMAKVGKGMRSVQVMSMRYNMSRDLNALRPLHLTRMLGRGWRFSTV